MIFMNKAFSSFGQMRALLWKEQMDGILDGRFKPPIGALIDITDRCNLKCYWCNAQSFRSENELETDHVFRIIDMLKAWGVKSVCFGGGGEPATYDNFAEVLRYAFNNDLEVGVSTNGTLLNTRMIQAIGECARFCGISIDAGTPATWYKLKGMALTTKYHTPKYHFWNNLFYNADRLAKCKGLDLTYKMLVVPENQHEIFTAAKMAKAHHFNNFFARFPALENARNVANFPEGYSAKVITEQLRLARELERERFRVYTTDRGIDRNFHKCNSFKQCRATPFVAVFCADGYCYPCSDHKQEPSLRMCGHMQIKNFWNSKKHHAIIKSLDVNKCPRCSWARYNEAIEAYETDYMFRYFP
jgi:MoaA/NifB/PqqE/SkfB family radical SAM enzyme